MPAYAVAPTAAGMPGTTSNGTPCSWRNSASFPRLARGEVPALGARRHAGLGHSDDRSAPRAIALGVLGDVANRVLTGDLVGDVLIDRRQLDGVVDRIGTAAALLRERTQDVVRI